MQYSSTILLLAAAVAAQSNYNSAMPTLSANPGAWDSWNTWSPQPSSSSSAAVVQAYPVSSTTPAAVVPQVPTTSVLYENPFTIYLTQTDSRGVVTGMPSVYTSQPTVVTSQVLTAVAPVKNGTTTMKTSLRTSSSSSTGFQQSNTASASFAVSTGAAPSTDRLTSTGALVIVLGMALSFF